MPETQQNYLNIGFDEFLQRIDPFDYTPNVARTSSQPQAGGSEMVDPTIKDGDSLADLWIANSIKSKYWRPRTSGFYIDGQTGYAEFADVYLSGEIDAKSGKISGALTIGTDGSIESEDFVSNSTGFKLNADGTVEFQDLNIGHRRIAVSPGQSIQDAIDLVDAAGGGVVFLKAGTHLPTTNITVSSNVIIEGEGIENTIIDFGALANQMLFKGTAKAVGGTGVTITEGSTTVTGVGGTNFLTNIASGDILFITSLTSGAYAEVSSVTDNTTLVLKNAWPYPTVTNISVSIFLANRNCQIRNLTITNSSEGLGTLGILHVERALNFYAENILVTKNTAAEGIILTTVINSELRNVESSYNGNDSSDDGFSLVSVKRVVLYNCSALGNAGNGFDIDSNSISEGNAFYSCFAEGNTRDGFDLNGTVNLFSCRSMGNDGDGYELNGDFNNLIGCSAIDNGADGVEVTATGGDNLIYGCYLKNNDAYGIDILASAARNTIAKCFFTTNASGTVRDAGTDTHYDNMGAGSFTATNGANNNIDVGDNLYVRISGPTGAFSISGIAAGINGKRVVLYNSTAFDMTITNDATSTAANRILTLTGADVTLTGVSVATFVYNLTDTRWIMVGSQG